VSVNYENRTYSGNSLQIEIDYSNQNQIVPIFQGASEFKLISGNSLTEKTQTPSSYFSIPSWVGISGNTSQNNVIVNYSSFQSLLTGSNSLILDDGNILVSGPSIFSSSIVPSSDTIGYRRGNSLSLIHSFNYSVKNQITASVSSSAIPGPPFVNFFEFIGIPQEIKIDPNDPNNYFYFNNSSSGMNIYESSNIPFVVERGDEIRIIYNASSTSSPTYVTQDFTVMSVTTSSNSYNDATYNSSLSISGASASSKLRNVYNTFIVYPNPSTLNIPNGKIQNYTIRRKVDNDQSVIVFQSPPPNDRGYQTLSGPGYLIPNDFTETQKRNALTLINNLKAKNAFRDDNDISLSI
jgi:hypothetical protein